MPVRDNIQLLKLRRKDGGGRTVTEYVQGLYGRNKKRLWEAVDGAGKCFRDSAAG